MGTQKLAAAAQSVKACLFSLSERHQAELSAPAESQWVLAPP
jgi:hypothetical protein